MSLSPYTTCYKYKVCGLVAKVDQVPMPLDTAKISYIIH